MSENKSAAGLVPQAARIVRIHAEHTPAGWRRQQRGQVPALLKQFLAPVTFRHLKGAYGFTLQLEAPAVYWGEEGRCWAFLHDFTSPDLDRLMGECAAAVIARRGHRFMGEDHA